MRVWNLLCAILLWSASAAAQVDLRVDLEPLEAEIGQPLTLVLTAEHAPSFDIEVPETILPAGTWVLLEDLGKLTLPHPSREGLELTVARWKVAALDSGEQSFRFPDVRWSNGSSAGLTELEPLIVDVAGALLEDEDAPRAAKGFRNPELVESTSSTWPWVFALAAAIALVVWRLRRRASSVAQAAVVAPRKGLESLGERIGELGVRGTYFELSRLLRSAIDEKAEDRSGLTDDEWLAAEFEVRDYSAEEQHDLRALFKRFAEVKYGGVEPTSFALEDSIGTARRLVDAGREKSTEVAA